MAPPFSAQPSGDFVVGGVVVVGHELVVSGHGAQRAGHRLAAQEEPSGAVALASGELAAVGLPVRTATAALDAWRDAAGAGLSDSEMWTLLDHLEAAGIDV